MPDKKSFLRGTIVGDCIVLDDLRHTITPQPEPTSPRIKELLSRGLMAPETLTPVEVQELSASVVYHLVTKPKK